MKKLRFLPFRQAIPALLLFDLVSVIILQLWLLGLSALSRVLLMSAGKVSVSSGDLVFLFTTPQGYALILLGLLTLYFYLAIDINALIILCGRLLRGEKPMVFKCLWEGVLSLRRFFGPRGLLIVLYLSLLTPLLHIGVSISLTKNFYIPNFISSVIFKSALYTIAEALVLLGLVFVGIVFIFILHGTLLDGMKLKESASNSIKLVKKNLKVLILELLRFVGIIVAILIGIILIFLMLPMIVVTVTVQDQEVLSYLSVAIIYFGAMLTLVFYSMAMPFFLLKLTGLYMRFKSDGEWSYQKREKKVSATVIIVTVVYILAGVAAVIIIPKSVNILFPEKIDVQVVAHRAGGNEAPENTLAGIDAAYRLGAYGSEIDIQRTKDGQYIVLHDDDFKRVCGVNKKPQDMTLAEVKELDVDGEPVPTLEEMLDSCKDRVTLLVELKGATADKQMADDAVRIIKERGMEQGAVLISLKYDLIEYIETNYPEMKTGYLAFASFGDTASLNCDIIMLEEESASAAVIASVHNNGKELYVWTVNDSSDIETFLQSNADAIITDSVSESFEIKERLESRSDYERIIDGTVRLLVQ